ncbi:hypothetical protein AB833_05905 [Chromatiales bacterium (ex Bugula neritina AB1)]|nr:hypothetical protein AB833_05905 [Chromatiales bacterium (ex Bugula neritina AB1)]
MSTKNFTIANFYLRKHYENGVRIGVDSSLMREADGASPELLAQPLARLAPVQLARLFHVIWEQADDEFLGMTLRPVRYGSFAWLAEQLVRCTTLGEVYETMLRFYNLVAEGIRFELKRECEQVKFILHHAAELDGRVNLLIDFLLLIWHRFPGWLIGRTIPLDHVELAFAEPWHSAEYRFVFPAPCRFEQGYSALVFDAHWLDAPLVQTRENLTEYLQRIPLQWFQKQHYPRLLSNRVTQLLAEAGWVVESDMETVAGKLNMTTRTLRRKLADEGVSFQQLKDGLRRDQAITLLGDNGLTIAAVGQQIGFAEPAAFSRAFRQWTGMSPLGYRRGLG